MPPDTVHTVGALAQGKGGVNVFPQVTDEETGARKPDCLLPPGNRTKAGSHRDGRTGE